MIRSLIIIAIASGVCFGQTVTVTRIVDGDTFETSEGDRVRIHGIDAPELRQLGGGDAAIVLSGLVLKKEVTLVGVKSSSWGRVEARVMRRGYDVGLTLVARGLAWVDDRYIDERLRKKYQAEFSSAKAKKLGIWRSNVAPWEFRSGITAPKSPVPVFREAKMPSVQAGYPPVYRPQVQQIQRFCTSYG